MQSVQQDPDGASSPFQLKWPNDLLLFGRKMAGILIESGERLDVQGQPERWISVGIGANLAHAPEVEGRSLACLAELECSVSGEEAARKILEKMDVWLAQWQAQGDASLWQSWLERAHPVGTRLAVTGRDTYMSGRFYGLDEQGRLLLENDNGDIIPVITGDVLCL